MLSQSRLSQFEIPDVTLAASRMCNMILRCFIVKTPEFYIRLYRSVIVPHILYCSVVWRPYLREHTAALDGIQSNFIRQIAARCDIAVTAVAVEAIADLFDRNRPDLLLLTTIRALPSFHEIFDDSKSSLRNALNLRPRYIVRTDRVNHMFAWRVSRIHRSV